MTTYFAFTLAEPTRQGVETLLGNLDAGVAAPQHELHTRVSVELVDETLRHCVEELIARFQSGSEGAGVLHTLLGVLKSTSNMLVRQMLGKTGNDEVNRMAKYLRDRRLALGGQPLFGFAMPDEMAAAYRSIFADIRAGRGEARKAELTALMLRFADLAVERFYDDFVAPMNLGFIKRKASDLGRATISKGVHVAVNKLVPSLGQKDLEVYADYFDGLFVDA